ncbi:MAG: PQQ-binding-like beta-propeller repeat protein [Pirellulales bacterium]|nr:PQQ-binding-like beta-propeller repeat protein [Pirellulales bacterium]
MSIRVNWTIPLALTICAGVVSAVSAADSPYWPRFQGPSGDGISTDTGLLKQWPEDGPKLAWTAKGIGEGFAGVTIADGRIFTAGNIDDKTVITALDLDGKVLWRADNGKAWTSGPGGTRGTPTIDGDRVYYENPYGDVVCLMAASGEKVWGLNILEAFRGGNITWALAESLLIDGDHLICLPGGSQASLVALDKMTGKVVWKAPSASGDKAGYATATLAEFGGVRMIFTMTQKALIGVNADNGDLLFRFEHKTEYDVNATKPIYHDGHVFISSGYGTTGSKLLKLAVAGGRVTAEQVWNSRELDNHHGGVILLDGYLYGASHKFNNGKWICLDWKTGAMKYAERGVGKGSLTCAEGMLYTMSEKRDVGLVKATPLGHEVISEFKTPAGPKGPTWAHPVVCGGRLYLRHDDNLYAYVVQAD